jgi:hypothetical protein
VRFEAGRLKAVEEQFMERLSTACNKRGDFNMQEYDAEVIKCFLKNQGKLFPEPVASNEEEAEFFLEDVCAVVVDTKQEVQDYFEEEGIDLEGEDPLSAAEVFALEDGRYLIVEG